ncbi:hypothetical protein CANINC_000260 [Pichia inconspicua]|uniref:Histone acetyltransferase n=1 Tax=Pichia inconspicua TaxID=52247 RepID=A0A4T0X872_9ASCO|nr:hypothetical protein CANINC_000260 [[Candida] inconspicua]
MVKRTSRRRSRSRDVDVSSNKVSNQLPISNDHFESDNMSDKVNTKKKKTSKSTRNNTASSLSGSNEYPKVDSVLLELPYRGLFDFEDANTYDTLPDENFKTLFDSFVNESSSQKKVIQQEAPSISKNRLKSIHFNNYEIDTWYKSPYPSKYNSNPIMHICPHCLAYYESSFTLERHSIKCSFKHKPGGREIYRDQDEKISLFEFDGRKHVIFCQNLCLLAKLFLNSKTLYYDVEPFIFYVLYDYSSGNFNFVGYFSKEKLNSTGYNLSCIMTLPIFQRRGFGSFLIDFSYLLSKREFKTGSPEKPLSHLGLLSYRSYWKLAIIRAMYHLIYEKANILQPVSLNDSEIRDQTLKEFKISIDDLSNLTGMCHDDVVVGLEQLNSFLIYEEDNKTEYALIFNYALVKQLYQSWQKKHTIKVKSDYLYWKPVILGPSGGINTNSTMVVTDEPNDDNLMKNISVIYNFLQDDLEDDRDIEEQTLEKVQLQQKESVAELSLIKSRICYPGMKFSKKLQMNGIGNQSKINGSIKRADKVENEIIDEEAVLEIFGDQEDDDIDDPSQDDDYDEKDANVEGEEEEDEDEEDDNDDNSAIDDSNEEIEN